MKVSIMQPYFFPYLGYYQLIANADVFIFLNDVNFIKKGWINRNRILINGEPGFFTVPLKDASQNRLIKDIAVNYDEKWQVKMLRSIEMNYKKALFFNDFYQVLERVIHSNTTSISELAILSINEVFDYLKMDINTDTSSNLDPDKKLFGQDRIIFLCELQKATHYINPEGGNELYQSIKFSDKGIELSFLKMIPSTYPQIKSNTFIPYLSMIDLLMNVSPETIRNDHFPKFDLKTN